jgi:hypothetical protein
MILTPEAHALGAQELLIDFADPFETSPHTVEVAKTPADAGDLSGVKSNLARLAAGVIHIEDPLEMALAAGASGARNSGGVKGTALKQRTAQDVVEWRQRANESCALGPLCHLYRCYTLK